MKNKKSMFILLFALCVAAQTYAQKGGHEYIQQKRVEFLILKMNLTVEESQKFWPVYNEYYKKKNNLSESYKKQYGDFRKFEGASEEEFNKNLLRQLQKPPPKNQKKGRGKQ